MIHPDQALRIVRGIEPAVGVEEIPLSGALGRILAGPVRSPIDSPPFDKSAMDGFAVAADDPSETFRIQETVAAGDRPRAAVRPGTCARIMTGAMLPEGAGRVIRVEFTEERDGVVRLTRPETARNVIERGENLRAGDVVLTPRVLGPQDIGVLAAAGVARLRVAVPPRVGILTTGSEIRDPGEELAPGQIYNSNGPQLAAQAGRLGCPVRVYGIVEDELQALTRAVASALEESDVLLLSGGVSMGDFDYVPRVLAECGVEVLFHGVAVKPGKPTLFGRLPAGERETFEGSRPAPRYVFGLPGNPVSTFIIFEVFVRPLLLRWMGNDDEPVGFRVRLAGPVRRKVGDRVEYLPVALEDGQARPLPYHGSAHLNALSGAAGLIRLEQGVLELVEGEWVNVRPI